MFDQLAFACRDVAFQNLMADHLRDVHGATFDAEDEVVTAGVAMGGRHIRNKARLLFSYDLWWNSAQRSSLGLEYELLCYKEGWNWHDLRSDQHRGGLNWLSHYGKHIDTVEQNATYHKQFRVLQEVVTVSHTNQNLRKLKRHYHYTIFDTRDIMGCELKTIRRITREEAQEWLARI